MGAQPLSGWDGLDMMGTEFDVPVPGIPGIGNFSFFWWYRNRYRKKLGPGKSLGTGIGKIWYWKKSRSWNQYYLIEKKFITHLAISFVPVSINHSMKAFSLCIYTFQIMLSSYPF